MLREAAGHPKFIELCGFMERAGVPHHEAVARGCLEGMWHFAARYTPRGDIGKHSNHAIAKAAGWEGDADQLISWLLLSGGSSNASGWLDADDQHRLVVHDWSEHADQTVHRSLARKILHFVDGTRPKMTKILKPERAGLEAEFAAVEEANDPQGKLFGAFTKRAHGGRAASGGTGKVAGNASDSERRGQNHAGWAPNVRPSGAPPEPHQCPAPPNTLAADAAHSADDPLRGIKPEQLVNMLGGDDRSEKLAWLTDRLPHIVAAAEAKLAERGNDNPTQAAVLATTKERMHAFYRQHVTNPRPAPLGAGGHDPGYRDSDVDLLEGARSKRPPHLKAVQ